MRGVMIALAVIAALNMLPPAWTPGRMITAEFRQQSLAIGLCLAAVAFSPFLALLPLRASAGLLAALTTLSILFPVHNFLSVLPNIGQLYNQPINPGWGMYVLLVGLAMLLLLQVSLLVAKPLRKRHQRPSDKETP
ncbi:MAG: hypothetical protein HC802_18150 [Caldilineaceae bacterium]|nr:hypothetical protein [Caldilineaceae bacterium]